MKFYDHSRAFKTKSNFNNWDKKNNFLEICSKNKKLYENIIKAHKFQTAGVFYAEMYAFLCFCELYEIDLIIESGMARGNSTELMLKYFKGDIYTFEHSKQEHHEVVEKRLSSYPNLKEILYQDSRVGIEKIIKSYPDKNIALFIDGPKDVEAVNLMKKCFLHKNVIFGGIHDICNPITKMRNNYDFMSKFGQHHVLSTDEEEFRNLYNYMDDYITDENGAWIYNQEGVSEKSFDKYAIRKRFPNGPGIGMAINFNFIDEE